MTIILIDNIQRHKIAFLSSTFSSVETPANEGPYIICTVNRASQLPEMQVSFQLAFREKVYLCLNVIEDYLNVLLCLRVYLKVHHDFRMFLLPNNMDAIKGYMGRFLRRRILECEFRDYERPSAEIHRIVDFLPNVLAAVNAVSQTFICLYWVQFCVKS